MPHASNLPHTSNRPYRSLVPRLLRPLLQGLTRTAALLAIAATLAVATPARADTKAADGAVAAAKQKLRAGDKSGAIRAIAQALTEDERHAEAHILNQQTKIELYDDGAEQMLVEYRQKAEANPEDAVFQFLHARLLPVEESLKAFQALSKKFKTSPWAHAGLGRAHELKGEYRAALTSYDKAVELDGKALRFRAFQAYTLERLGEWSTAADAWQRVLDLDAKDIGALIGLGDAYRHLGEYESAVEVFGKAIAQDPLSAEALYRLGLTYLDQGDFENALKKLKLVLVHHKTMIAAMCALSETELKHAVATAKAERRELETKDVDAAIKQATRALGLEPENPACHFALGAVYEALGEFDLDAMDKCLESYSEALDLLPFPGSEKVRALTGKAYAMLRLGSFEDSMALVKQILDIDKQNVSARIYAGHALVELDKAEEAIKKQYKPALKFAKDDPRLHFGMGTAYWDLGKLGDAEKEILKAVKLDPKNGLYHFTLGEIYFDRNKYDKAVSELFDATELRPWDAWAWSAYGRACCHASHWDEGIEAYEKVIELEPETVTEHLYLAILFSVRKKDDDKAREHLLKFSEKGGTEQNLSSWIERMLSE